MVRLFKNCTIICIYSSVFYLQELAVMINLHTMHYSDARYHVNHVINKQVKVCLSVGSAFQMFAIQIPILSGIQISNVLEPEHKLPDYEFIVPEFVYQVLRASLVAVLPRPQGRTASWSLTSRLAGSRSRRNCHSEIL